MSPHNSFQKNVYSNYKPEHSIVYFITDAVDFMIEVDRPSLEVTPTTKRLVLLIVACCVGLCVLFLCSVSLIHFQLKKLSATLHLDLRPWHRNLAQIEVEEKFICHVTKNIISTSRHIDRLSRTV